MKVLGISFGYHDSSVAIVENGNILVCSDEERFSRIKHDNSFPVKSINFCLNYVGISIEDIHKVVYYENPYKKLNRALEFGLNSKEQLSEIITQWTRKEKLDPLSKISDFFNISREMISYVDHHFSHAAGTFFASTLNEATIVTVDGVGEYETLTISYGKDNNIEKIKSITLPNSLGMLYSAITSFLGFEVNEGEYKVMGMASYGKPIFKEKIYQCLTIYDNGEFKINEDFFNFLTPNETHLKDQFFEVFGKCRDSSKDFFVRIEDAPKNLKKDYKTQLLQENIYYANIAASLQSVTEEVLLLNIKEAIRLTGSNNLCLSGGVALNATANGRIKREINLDSFFILPAAGDSGGALGAALYYTYMIKKLPRVYKSFDTFLGAEYSSEEILNSIDDFMLDNYEKIEDIDLYTKKVAELISQNNVIGFYNGRFEFGPRALGHRSILANPISSEMKHIVNEKIKFRELFRPFAPAVLYDKADEWFEISLPIDENSPENYMISTMKVLDDKVEKIPAVTHVDQTARIQLVKEDNLLYFKIIKAFEKITGVPIILNTSFNLKGDAIVNTPSEAIKTFESCDMDILSMYPYIIYK